MENTTIITFDGRRPWDWGKERLRGIYCQVCLLLLEKKSCSTECKWSTKACLAAQHMA